MLERLYLCSVLSVTWREFRCVDPALSLFCEAIRAKIGFADMGLSTLLVDWCHYVNIVFKSSRLYIPWCHFLKNTFEKLLLNDYWLSCDTLIQSLSFMFCLANAKHSLASCSILCIELNGPWSWQTLCYPIHQQCSCYAYPGPPSLTHAFWAGVTVAGVT